jgi:acyl carrier protein
VSEVSAAQVRAFISEQLGDELRAAGADPAALPDDYDLHAAGVIDSFGILELIGGLEERFGLEIDYEELDPEELTVVGPFARYVEAQSHNAGG